MTNSERWRKEDQERIERWKRQDEEWDRLDRTYDRIIKMVGTMIIIYAAGLLYTFAVAAYE